MFGAVAAAAAVSAGMVAAGGIGAAIIAGAVSGAVVGAVVGGISAAIKGENIFKGALKGGLIGAVSGGILGGVTHAAEFGTAGIDSAAAARQTSASSMSSGGGVPGAGEVSGQGVTPLAPVEEKATSFLGPGGAGGTTGTQPATSSFLGGLGDKAQAAVIETGGKMIAGAMAPDQAEAEQARFEAAKASRIATPVSNPNIANIASINRVSTAEQRIEEAKKMPSVTAQSYIDWTKEAYKRNLQPVTVAL